MNALGRWVGVVGLWWALAGGAATILAADGGSPAPGSTASGVFLSSDPVVAAGSTIGDSLVQPTSASSVVEDTSDLLDTNLPGRSCCDEPAWIVSGGAVFLHRSRPDPTAIATPSSGQGTLISGSNLGFNWNSGPLVSIGRRTASGLIIEGRYFNDRDATASYNLDNITTFRTAGIGVTILGGGSLSSTYQTQLDSTELNVLKPLNDRLSLIGGFRAVQLHDQLNVNITSPSIYTNWNENNRLYGAQTGINLNLFEPGRALQFNGALKAGVYGNGATNLFTSRIVADTTSNAAATAFVGELNFTASYAITKRLSIRGGYMVLWVDGLALADRAAANTRQVAGGTSSPANLHGDLWYNGALASLDYVW